MSLRRAIGVLFAPLLLAGCGDASMPMAIIVQNEPYALSISHPQRPKTGEPITMTLETRLNGSRRTVEEDVRMMHVIFASEDLEDISHSVYPERVGNGRYAIPFTFTRPGKYRLWVEVSDLQKRDHHGPNADLIAVADIVVEGSAMSSPPIVHGMSALADGYTIDIEPKTIRAGRETTLQLRVMDANGATVPLPPEDAITFAMTGQKHGFFLHGHGKTAADGVSVHIPVTFPFPGVYAFVAQPAFLVGEEWKELEGRFLLTVDQ